MKSKTLKLMREYYKLIREQGEDTSTIPVTDPSQTPEASPTDAVAPTPAGSEVPPTSSSENNYVEALVYGASYTPTSDQIVFLNKLKNEWAENQYINPPQDILPILLKMIGFRFGQDDSNKDKPHEPGDELQLTPELENTYINQLIDATLHSPTPSEAMKLNSLKDVFRKGLINNSREEIMPDIISIVSTETDNAEIKKDLQNID